MFQFDLLETIQAVAFLIQQAGKDHDAYLKLLKLLYLAERESLLETGHPFTGDKTYAMEHGPALSVTCNLMNGSTRDELWDKYITGTGDRELKVVCAPGIGRLCEYECEKLKELSRRFADKDRWQTVDEVHKLPEWIRNDPGDSSKQILVKHILEAGGKRKMLKQIMRDAKEEDRFREALGA